MVRFTLLLAIIALFGCSPQKRLARICTKYPSLCENSDTMRDTSFVVMEYERIDTQLISAPVDTIVIENEKVRTVIYRQHDTLRVTQTIEADTVFTIKERVVTKIKTNQSPMVIAVIIVLLWAIYRRVTR